MNHHTGSALTNFLISTLAEKSDLQFFIELDSICSDFVVDLVSQFFIFWLKNNFYSYPRPLPTQPTLPLSVYLPAMTHVPTFQNAWKMMSRRCLPGRVDSPKKTHVYYLDSDRPNLYCDFTLNVLNGAIEFRASFIFSVRISTIWFRSFPASIRLQFNVNIYSSP